MTVYDYQYGLTCVPDIFVPPLDSLVRYVEGKSKYTNSRLISETLQEIPFYLKKKFV